MYMSSICSDLLNIVDVVNDFQNFLGPELKAVTGDIDGIDLVNQVCLHVLCKFILCNPPSLNHGALVKYFKCRSLGKQYCW